MFVRYDISHTTIYRYASPVTFGEHRVMFRPRDSHDLRVLATDLQVSPASAIRLIQDPHSNSVALVQPRGEATELRIVCTFTIEHAHSQNLELPVLPRAEVFPIAYTVDERFDLELYLRPHHDDPGGELTAWAQRFVMAGGPPRSPRDALVAMNRAIRDEFRYTARDEEGVQSPHETLALRTGSCRDFALLMIEAARRLGMAARFVSGYLYDPALDQDIDGDGAADVVGAGTTHAWLQVYLPGAGWVPFDPTNNLLGGNQLIRVGVARHPAQAAPISGVWYGPRDAYLGLAVEVQLRRHR
jgi:transglutaminase-like putative cysteine protease